MTDAFINPINFGPETPVGYDGSQVAGATDQGQEIRDKRQETENQRTENKNIFQKIWSGIKGAANWVIDLFKADETNAQSATYSVVLTAHGDSGSDTASQVVDLNDIDLCSFNLLEVTNQSCHNLGLRWDRLGDNSYNVYRCQSSNCGSCAYANVGTISSSSCSGSVCETDALSSVEENKSYCYYLSVEDIGLKNSTASPNPVCSGQSATCPLSETTDLCLVDNSGMTWTSSCGKITLTWPEVDDAVFYRVYRSIGGSTTFSLLDTVTAVASPSYEDKNVITVNTTKPANSFRYQYKVISKIASADWPDPANTNPFPAIISDGAYSYCYRGPGWEER